MSVQTQAQSSAQPSAPSPAFRSRDDLVAYLRQVRIVDDPIDGRALIDATKEIDEYVWLHARSAELSLAMLAEQLPPGRRLRVLELGGAPYFFSALMHRSFDVELTAANVQAAAWPGEPATLARGRVTLAVPGGKRDGAGVGAGDGAAVGAGDGAAVGAGAGAGDGADRGSGGVAEGRLEIEVRVFNIEKDPFPFDDDSFDVVLCMEVLEHLAYSPSHMLAESHRVLAPGGLFFLTVPNFINVKRLVNMFLNRPTEYPYSGYGVYGRHAREFAPAEVKGLFDACHYAVVDLRTANVWPTFRNHWFKGLGNGLLNALTALPLPWLAAKREYILCAARPVGTAVAAYPSWLYTHRHLYPDPPHGVPKDLGP